MSNERKPGYYWAKIKFTTKIVIVLVTDNGILVPNLQGYLPYIAFEWISPQTIEDKILGLKQKEDELEELLKCEVEKTNTTISSLLKLKSKIKDLTIDDIGREIVEIIGEAVKNDSITKP